jgi:hypothetical protein
MRPSGTSGESGDEIARISSARSARTASPTLMYAQACSKSARSKNALLRPTCW